MSGQYEVAQPEASLDSGSRAPLADKPGSDVAILVEGLVKRYGGTAAVDGLSFSVGVGEIFALLGPNGAGKTSTIEILEGYRSRDGGRVQVLGVDPQRTPALKQRIGIMPQQSALYPNITVREALDLFCSYYRQPADPAALLHLVGLQDRAGARFKMLSGGQKQRLSLGLALAGNPELLFLDEPTASMDPQARLTTWELIGRLRSHGATLVLTTHYLEEAHRLADRAAIIDHGRLVALGTPHELTVGAGGDVRFLAEPGLPLHDLQRLSGVSMVREERQGVYVAASADPDETLIDIAVWSRTQSLRVRDLRVERATLEDVFLQLTTEETV